MFSYNLIAYISSVQMVTHYFLCVWPMNLQYKCMLHKLQSLPLITLFTLY